MLRNITLLFFLLVYMSSCVEPYNVVVSKYKDLLVVDAQITNENKSHEVKLTRSIANLDVTPTLETDAVVIISCDDGTNEILKEVEPGVYKTDSVNFIVKVGGVYTLSIQTSNGKKYHSDKCEILEPTEIDRVYFDRNELISVNNESLEGISFFVDGKAAENSYLRWMYEEGWKFSVPYPTRIGFDENNKLKHIPSKNRYCWKKSSSNQILIQSLQSQNTTEIKGKEVCFIPSDNTDKFNMKYAINIKQLRISKKEYDFLDKLKESSEEVGDISGTQPFSIKGNIISDTDEDEPVLGYFQTGSVTSSRVFIDHDEALSLPLFLRDNTPYCPLDTVLLDNERYKVLYDIYEKFDINGSKRVFDVLPLNSGLLFVYPRCCDCSVTGSLKKPLYWED